MHFAFSSVGFFHVELMDQSKYGNFLIEILLLVLFNELYIFFDFISHILRHFYVDLSKYDTQLLYREFLLLVPFEKKDYDTKIYGINYYCCFYLHHNVGKLILNFFFSFTYVLVKIIFVAILKISFVAILRSVNFKKSDIATIFYKNV